MLGSRDAHPPPPAIRTPLHARLRDPSAVSMKRLLVVAFHFPPFAGSSGIQRTLRFVQHLPSFGWQAIVLTCSPHAYTEIKPDLLREIPDGTVVERAFALDTARHLAFGGRYPEWLARPDRWVSWWPGAVLAGRRILRKHRPHALLSTYPVATAHLVGSSIARAGGLPWVADFRDPMAQVGYPEDPRTWASFKRVEERVFGRAAACTFTTPGSMNLYCKRYPDSKALLEVIENGYDEGAFSDALASPAQPLNPGVPTLLHSGIVYPAERDPTQLFAALSALRRDGVDGNRLRIRFRAAVNESLVDGLAKQHGVADMIELLPHVPYRDALREMACADGLLLIQGSNCNEQVPAKLYEYLRARRPLIALTDSAGDTATVLRATGVDAIARLDSAADIARVLSRFVQGARQGMLATDSAIAQASRSGRAGQLAALLDRVSLQGRR